MKSRWFGVGVSMVRLAHPVLCHGNSDDEASLLLCTHVRRESDS